LAMDSKSDSETNSAESGLGPGRECHATGTS
jgi:hypothetical protein